MEDEGRGGIAQRRSAVRGLPAATAGARQAYSAVRRPDRRCPVAGARHGARHRLRWPRLCESSAEDAPARLH